MGSEAPSPMRLPLDGQRSGAAHKAFSYEEKVSAKLTDEVETLVPRKAPLIY